MGETLDKSSALVLRTSIHLLNKLGKDFAYCVLLGDDHLWC